MLAAFMCSCIVTLFFFHSFSFFVCLSLIWITIYIITWSVLWATPQLSHCVKFSWNTICTSLCIYVYIDWADAWKSFQMCGAFFITLYFSFHFKIFYNILTYWIGFFRLVIFFNERVYVAKRIQLETTIKFRLHCFLLLNDF